MALFAIPMHWLTIRKVQNVWYNLNSTNMEGPEIISDFYLRLKNALNKY